jgi:CHAT domain-containing protein/tetratricopeptide (TPR) repeat protein
VRIETPASIAPDDEELRFWGSAGEILRYDDADRSASARHLSGIASLAVGQGGDAVAELQDAVDRNPADAAAWSDLAAARYTVAARSADPQRLPAALSAVDRALRLQPTLAEARFNRALILALLGLHHEAESAWASVLLVERDPHWAAEARARRHECAFTVPRRFTDDLKTAFARLTAGDRAPFQNLIRRRVQDARVSAESRVLTDWAEAEMRGDTSAAGQALAEARLIGAELAKTNGDLFLQDVVSVIDATPPGSSRRRGIAAAHLAYRDGRVDISRQRGGGDEKLRVVAGRFAELGSPMAHVARYYGANGMYDRNRPEDARRMLDRVLRDVDARRYRSLAAGAEKQLGLYYGHRGVWTAALLHLERARATFEQLGEWRNAAFTQAIVGEVYDRIGQPDNGWRHRSAALDTLSRFPSEKALVDPQLVAVLVGGVHAETMRGDYESALSLVRIALDESRETQDVRFIADTLIRQARVLLMAGRLADAGRAIDAVRTMGTTIPDPRVRTRLEVDVAAVEGELLTRTKPCDAVDVILPAVDYYRTNGIGMLLPSAYLQLGRAHLGCGERSLALSDFGSGLAEIERQRSEVAPDIRTTVFDTVPDLLGEFVALLLAEHRDAAAFAVVERARARTLVEALGIVDSAPGTSSAMIAGSLKQGTLLIEYVLLPHDVAAFCITRHGMAVVMLGVDPLILRRESSELSVAISGRRPRPEVQQFAAKIFDRLIAPIARYADAADRLIIVPDRFLHALPYPALFDATRNRFLIESHRLVIAPSGAFTLRKRSPAGLSPALIISDPAGEPDDPRLPAAREEAAAIAGIYERATLLAGRDATAGAFVKKAARSHLIHYAGHAHEDDAARGFLRFAAPPGVDGSLDVTRITRLPLRGTRIVVLSACATMRGTAHVEGMPSIARAFLTAGVQSVVGMLWDVDDRSTAALVLRFHRRLRSGDSPSAALQAAQCALLRDPDERLSHPAAWAAAELLGND